MVVGRWWVTASAGALLVVADCGSGDDLEGNARDGTPDVGAYELGSIKSGGPR